MNSFFSILLEIFVGYSGCGRYRIGLFKLEKTRGERREFVFRMMAGYDILSASLSGAKLSVVGHSLLLCMLIDRKWKGLIQTSVLRNLRILP